MKHMVGEKDEMLQLLEFQKSILVKSVSIINFRIFNWLLKVEICIHLGRSMSIHQQASICKMLRKFDLQYSCSLPISRKKYIKNNSTTGFCFQTHVGKITEPFQAQIDHLMAELSLAK